MWRAAHHCSHTHAHTHKRNTFLLLVLDLSGSFRERERLFAGTRGRGGAVYLLRASHRSLACNQKRNPVPEIPDREETCISDDSAAF